MRGWLLGLIDIEELEFQVSDPEKLKLIVVNHRWVEDCVEQGRRVSESSYMEHCFCKTRVIDVESDDGGDDDWTRSSLLKEGVHDILQGLQDRPWNPVEPRINKIVFIRKNLDAEELEKGFETYHVYNVHYLWSLAVVELSQDSKDSHNNIFSIDATTDN
nr:COBW domain-containing protein 1 [Tanacetum cinerariifolium]